MIMMGLAETLPSLSRHPGEGRDLAIST